MKRVQLFEFEDFKWFPSQIRSSMTNLIVVLHKMLKIDEVLAKLTGDAMKKHKINTIVDLGSGSGGAMPMVMDKLTQDDELKDVSLTMTDLYPNKKTIQYFEKNTNDTIRYFSEPVDATNLASSPEGLKTIVNCFHHMRPEQAKKILKSAKDSKQPLLIYEMAENKMPLLLWWLLLPISLCILVVMTLFMTPFVRPLTWQQLVFTYLIPIIPLSYAWDGQASMPRMYTMKDMDELLEGLSSEDYVWEKGQAKNAKGKVQGTYVLGTPVL